MIGHLAPEHGQLGDAHAAAEVEHEVGVEVAGGGLGLRGLVPVQRPASIIAPLLSSKQPSQTLLNLHSSA